MAHSSFSLRIFALLAAFGLPCGALAASEASADMPIAQEQVTPQVPFTSGGVGEDDLAAMKKAEANYNLKLLISEANGVFLSDASVTLMDAQGYQLLDTQTEGPIFLAKLKPGTYRVIVRSENVTKDVRVEIKPHKRNAYAITFPTENARVTPERSTTLQ